MDQTRDVQSSGETFVLFFYQKKEKIMYIQHLSKRELENSNPSSTKSLHNCPRHCVPFRIASSGPGPHDLLQIWSTVQEAGPRGWARGQPLQEQVLRAQGQA